MVTFPATEIADFKRNLTNFNVNFVIIIRELELENCTAFYSYGKKNNRFYKAQLLSEELMLS